MATLGIWPSSGLPCHRSVPEDGCARPVRMRSRVDLPQPEGSKQSHDLAWFDDQIGESDDLNPRAIGLRIRLLHADGFDNRLDGSRFTHRVAQANTLPLLYTICAEAESPFLCNHLFTVEIRTTLVQAAKVSSAKAAKGWGRRSLNSAR